MRTYVYIGLARRLLAARVAIENGYTVTPPQLTRYAPVADIVHPIIIRLFKTLGDEFYLARLDCVDSRLGELFHAHEPLLGYHRLDGGLAALAMSDVVRVVLGLFEQPPGTQIGDYRGARIFARHSLVLACLAVHSAVVVHDADNWQIVAFTDLEIVGVVGGRYLDRSRAEIFLHVFVKHYGDLSADERKNEHAPLHSRITRVLWIDRDRGIAEERFRSCRRNGNVTVTVLERIFYMPKMRRFGNVIDFGVGYCRLTARTPVDYTVAAVDIALVVKLDEHLAHGFAALLVHSERHSRPIQTYAERFELLDYTVAVLALPRPCALQKSFAPYVGFAQTLVAHRFHDFHFGRYGRVIVTGQPERFIALHALETHDCIGYRHVHRVTDVQLTSYIGRRQNDRKLLFLFAGLGCEITVVKPSLIDPLFKAFRIVSLIHIRCISD